MVAKEERPEAQLLLLAARANPGSADVDGIRTLLVGRIDWEDLLRLARRHSVVPLLYSNLVLVGPSDVPRAALERIGGVFQYHLRRCTFMAGELGRLLDQFEDQGIQAVPYKGPVLAQSLYGNVGLRYSGDLDILVRPERVLAARDVLVEQGYRPRLQLTPAQEASYIQSRLAYELERADGAFFVEIHWRVAWRYFSFDLDLEEVWGRLRRTEFNGRSVWALAPEDLLLLLCVHGAKHRWERLGWICDIAQLLHTHPTLDWVALAKLARGTGTERILLLGLFLASDLLGAALPEELGPRVQTDPAVRSLAAQVRRELFDENVDWEDHPERGLALRLFHLRARERLRDRLRYCIRLATTPSVGEWELLRLPAVLSFLYAPFRPFRLAAKYGLGRLKTWR